jgi:predicted O-methyltransferase YrrM
MIDYERITAYINSLSEDMPQELICLEEEALNNHVPVIRKETQGLLKFLLRIKKPRSILEVGTAIGFSALFMSEYTDDACRITTIEKVPMRLKDAVKNLSDVRFPKRNKIRLIKGEAMNILKELADNEEKYDFIFLDAAKAQYMSFLPELLRLMQQGCLLVTDNVLQDGTVINSRFSITRRDRTIHSRMREYLYTITHMEELASIILPIGDGIAISCML